MFKLKRNMGSLDRVARFLAGTTLLVIGPLTDLVATDLLSNVILSCMAGAALISSGLSYCFLYEVTGFGTFSEDEN